MTHPEPFVYIPGFLAAGEADRALEILWRDLAWRQYKIRMFGREIDQPRLTAWCSDPGVVYTYSRIRLPPTAWHPELDGLRSLLRRKLSLEFNSVLANAYRDGRDAMGWHADDEPELGHHPSIASLSLGAERRMLARPRAGGRSRVFDLKHGSLLLMQGRSQDDWMHAVPRTRKPVGLRINLTFRKVEAK